MESITERVFSRIYGHGMGWVFSQIDFFDLGSKNAIDKLVSRSAKKGTIRRLMQGLYDYPIYSKLLDEELPPKMDKVAEAVARKYTWNIIPEGSTALHLLGLDLQVPARYTFLSSGPSREYHIQEQKLTFLHRKISHTMIKDHYTATLVQAIQAIGRGNITNKQRKQLSSLRTAKEYLKIIRETKSITAWIHDVIIHIANLTEHEENNYE